MYKFKRRVKKCFMLRHSCTHEQLYEQRDTKWNHLFKRHEFFKEITLKLINKTTYRLNLQIDDSIAAVNNWVISYYIYNGPDCLMYYIIVLLERYSKVLHRKCYPTLELFCFNQRFRCDHVWDHVWEPKAAKRVGLIII